MTNEQLETELLEYEVKAEMAALQAITDHIARQSRYANKLRKEIQEKCPHSHWKKDHCDEYYGQGWSCELCGFFCRGTEKGPYNCYLKEE